MSSKKDSKINNENLTESEEIPKIKKNKKKEETEKEDKENLSTSISSNTTDNSASNSQEKPPITIEPQEDKQSEEKKIPFQNKLTYYLLSASSGLSEFSSLSLLYFFKDVLQASPSELSIINSITILPLIFKPLFGLISDMYPIFGYRRKIYIIVCGIVESLAWIAMSFIDHSTLSAAICLLISTSCVSFSSSIGDAIAVQLNNESNQKKKKKTGINKVFIYRGVGLLISSILRALVVQYVSIKIVFLIASILPLLTIISGIIYLENKTVEPSSYTSLSTVTNTNDNNSETETGNNNNVNTKNILSFRNFLSKINKKEILIPMGYLIILTSPPAYMDSSFYYLTEHKKFSPNSFGLLTIILTVVMIIQLVIYNRFLSQIPIKKLIPWSLLFSFIFSSLFNVWISFDMESEFFLYFSISLYVGIKQTGIMPIMNVGCNVCPENYEGSVYSLFTSGANLGRTLSGFFGSLMTILFGIKKGKYDNFNVMVFVHNLISLVPIPILFCIPTKYLEHSKENNKKPLRETVIEVKIEMESSNNNSTELENDNDNNHKESSNFKEEAKNESNN